MINNNRLYLFFEQDLILFNISDIKNIKQIDSLELPFKTLNLLNNKIIFHKNHLFMVPQNKDMIIIDVSDESNLKITKTKFDIYFKQFYIKDDFMYIISIREFRIYNIEDLKNIKHSGFINLNKFSSESFSSITNSYIDNWGILYLSCIFDGLWILGE